MPRRISRLAFASAVVLSSALPSVAEEVVVFAAASMKTALDEIAADFEATTGHDVTISYAGSGQLARQIIEGAPADIFISAAADWMDAVAKAGLLADGTRTDILGNSLVLVAHGTGAEPVEIGRDLDLAGHLGEGRLAMALVDAVPAGQYGKAALESLGLWSQVETRVAQSDNVRAALALVSMGEAPLGIVYATDAAADDAVTVIGTFPADSHPPITYPAAVLTNAADAADRAFFEALMSDKGDRTFAEQGFVILN
ncbi:molybdate ABC transporter substrate-binding protein [Aliigemmobacter aestuarii]|uniref:Molybdate ABC transporter substrate-binding protein n=1 Tax=Aliigemmobacter aestuarii TaxID=1445661 RepID=A0A4S3MRQ0_9RHOB|nr:molybdate ABC transporter substrate-binding protein [Gemmobacter aestuarii]THD84753.1 molybdate ABC transporter substrate-binding protein [Gemmobacter aestuarii]